MHTLYCLFNTYYSYFSFFRPLFCNLSYIPFDFSTLSRWNVIFHIDIHIQNYSGVSWEKSAQALQRYSVTVDFLEWYILKKMFIYI